MRCLFHVDVLPILPYGYKVWAPYCSRVLGPELKAMLKIEITLRRRCHLGKSVTSEIVVRNLPSDLGCIYAT